MADLLVYFESVARKARLYSHSDDLIESEEAHPFDERNMHPDIAKASQRLFDDAHYSQATFEAYKLVDKRVSSASRLNESGVKLMLKAFNENNPVIKLTNLTTTSEKDEQKGYMFLFSGSVMAIRNPRGHEPNFRETPSECLDNLSLASMLLRKLETVPTS